MGTVLEALLGEAQTAVEVGDWHTARARFEVVLEQEEIAEARFGLGMSVARTGAVQRARLAALGIAPAMLPTLRDVDVIADAFAVAAAVPATGFARAVAALESSGEVRAA